MKCAVTNAADIGLSKVISITIEDTKDGFCILSSADVFDGVKKSPGFRNAGVMSNLRGNAPFLSMTWTKPTAKLNGAYSCEIVGIDRRNQPIRFVTHHNIKIEKPTVEEMTNHTLQIQETYDKVEKQLQDIKQKNYQLNQENLTLGRKLKAKLTTETYVTTELKKCKIESVKFRQEIMKFNHTTAL